MSQFRIYKRLNYDWVSTSYAGEMFALKKILKSLSKSNIYKFKLVKEW